VTYDRRGMDTPLDIQRLQAELMRRMGPEARLARCLAWSRELIEASQRRVFETARASGLDEHEAHERWVRQQYGPEVARGYAAYRRRRMGTIATPESRSTP